ncbi:Cna B-type domain-containing protein [Enterococcus sp. AZ163]|uniref:Cna B-type domain-containing protein n=1 Tax=Enterococcus sp. AZ163 TaxID=2774638 RepID=UPI003D28D458
MWKDNDNKLNTRPRSITVRLYQNGKEYAQQNVIADASGNWNYAFTNLPKLDEKGAAYNYTVKEDPIKDYKTKIDGTTITNTYENKETTEISGQKIWKDNDNKLNTRPVSIKIHLYQNDIEYDAKEVQADKTGNWTYSFTNLPKYDANGEAYNYTVKEDPVKNYETKVEGTNITNTYENKETTEISGQKIWKDSNNKFNKRPRSITIRLYQGGKEYARQNVIADATGNWTYSFTNLPKYDAEGKAYNYTVKEDPVKDYKTKVEGNNITNTYENKETTEISGQKIWKDNDNKLKTRPVSIKIHLYQNGKEFDAKEVQADRTGNWTYSFMNLPKYDAKGDAYNYTVKEDPVKDYETKVEGNNITNTYENKETTEISGQKIWKDNDNKFNTRPVSIKIHLYQNDKEFDVKKVQADKTGNWTYSFTSLPKYDAKGDAYNYTVKEDPVKDYETKVEGTNITNTYENKETTEISGQKIWKDSNNKFNKRPRSITIRLYQSGKEYARQNVIADAAGNWTYSFINLPKYDAEGKAYNYTVKEDPVKDYETKVEGNNITNTYENKETTEISGQKIWKDNDNKFNTRPVSIKIHLYQNDKEFDAKEVQADKTGNWTYSFTSLPKYDAKGDAYNYTVKEDPVKDYETKVEGNNITNTYENKETTEISGQKIWKDNDNKLNTRPVSITIHLYQNDKEFDTKKVQADKTGNWTYSFTSLPKYDAKGDAYNYTVKEDPVKDYETKVEGNNITNTYENKETTEISGQKIWKDNDNKFNTRPVSINIHLYQNDKEFDTKKVQADKTGNWAYSFTNLPKYDDKGEAYNYTVKEDPVKDYETKVEGNNITNTYENKETTEISGQKIWKDNDNKFNTRPVSINIHLYQNDKEFASKKVQADKTGNWAYSFMNLPKYDAKGDAYNYTVKEDPVKDYETKVEGNNITNTYENKETTEISGKKIWKDYDNKFNTRPVSIKIHLYQNDKEFDAKEVQADKTGNWTYSFTDLPKYDAKGEAYNYTVKEDPVKDYQTKVEGTTIINTHENKETTEINGQKIWKDNDNKFNTRPEAITVRLFQNDREYDTKEVQADKTGNWAYSFTNLPKYDDKGEAYNYTVKEDPVKDYQTKVEGNNITNTYENKETTEISGKKIWKDYDNKFNTRPASINIHLYQNDKEFDAKKVQADKTGNWSYSFTNLPKYDAKGEAYNYTVKEDPVKDYQAKVEGTTITNTYENKEFTEISGKKIWKDYDNKFNTRPASINIHLYQNDKEFDAKKVQADRIGNWTYSFTNLPKYDDKGEAYNYTVKEDPVKDYKTKVDGTTIINTYENKETTEISGKKIWKDYDNKFKTRPRTINIHLYQNDKEFDSKEIQADKSGNWTYSFTNLPKYDDKGEAYNYTVKEDPVKNYQTKVEGNNITNTYENKETTEINGKKIWKDYDNKFKTRPVSIKIHLYQNDKEFDAKEVQADKTGNWTYSFTNLPKYDDKGEAYNYTVKEDLVKDYQTKVEGTTITNTYENNETTEISGQKIWKDYKNKFETRTESIKIRLYQNGKEFKKQEVKAADNWRYHFVNLPKYDGKGEAYSYSVKEDPVKNYKTKVDGTTIINTYENKETTEISGKKIWKDYENKFKTRPESITVRLLQNDKEYATKEIKADESGNWAYSFTNLPKYDEQGEAYNYSVKEDPVKEYESEVKGTAITNTYKNKETTEISGEKIWKDYENKFKTRPESITVRLLQNDKEYAAKEIKADESGNWAYSFINLPKYDEQGEAYNYSVKEDPVKEYKSEVKGTAITNTYKNKETTEISGEKTWKDYNNKFKTRPESITVRLLQNDKEYAAKEIKADESGNWAYSFINLPKYDEQGEAYNYSVKEDPVKEYESEVKGTAITNTYKNKETTEISGEKIWKDYNNKFKTRPESITVRLLQNDKEYATKEIKADESGNWTYSFTDLPKYDEQGNAYNYTVKEDLVKGYETTIEDTTIINTYTDKEVTEISGQKFWKDNEDKFKTRPKSITVRLYQNNKEKVVKEVKPDESGEWKYNFTNLPKFDKDGKAYDYTLTEDPVKGYETKIEGTNITNTYDFDEPTTKTEKPNRETNTPIMTTSGRTAVTQLPRTGSLYESVLVLLGLLILLCVVSIWYINDKRNRRG